MKRLLAPIIMISAQLAWSGEFHTFTSKDGKTVKAKIISVNAIETKIELERENGRKTWVSRNIFSIEDQTYIDAWIKNPDGTDTGKPTSESASSQTKVPLTKREVKAIAKQYEKAWSNADYDLYCKLCMNPCTKRRFNQLAMKSFSIIGYDDSNFEVKFNLKILEGHDNIKGVTYEWTDWVQLAPNGEIKYEPYRLGMQHPMIYVMIDLYNRGIPFAGLTPTCCVIYL